MPYSSLKNSSKASFPPPTQIPSSLLLREEEGGDLVLATPIGKNHKLHIRFLSLRTECPGQHNSGASFLFGVAIQYFSYLITGLPRREQMRLATTICNLPVKLKKLWLFDGACLKQYGFTLIELVITILILAIISAVAIPRFLDTTTDARYAATQAVAGALGAASANNYGIRKANSSQGSPISNCNQMGSLSVGLPPSGYVITSLPIAADVATACTVTNPDGVTTAQFTGIGIL